MPRLEDFPDLPRRESSRQEKILAKELFDAFDRVEKLHQVFNGDDVREGTSLAGDNNATPYESLSAQAETCIGVAFDNLRSVGLIIGPTGNVPAFAHFGLIRNAIEAIGSGLWLLGPQARDERVIRSLQLAFEDRKDIHSLEMAIASTPSRLPDSDVVKRRLERLRSERPEIARRPLSPPTISDRLSAAQEFTAVRGYSLLVAWKLTSGIAHGRRSAMFTLLDREVLSSDDTGVRLLMTSSLGATCGLYKIAERYLYDLIALFSARNGNPIDIPGAR